MMPQHVLMPPVVLSQAEWDTIAQGLGFLPGMVGQPIIAAIQAQVQAALKAESEATDRAAASRADAVAAQGDAG